MRVTLRLAWYDLWIGAYVDTAGRRLYVCPLPCVLVTVHLPRRKAGSSGESRP